MLRPVRASLGSVVLDDWGRAGTAYDPRARRDAYAAAHAATRLLHTRVSKRRSRVSLVRTSYGEKRRGETSTSLNRWLGLVSSLRSPEPT